MVMNKHKLLVLLDKLAECVVALTLTLFVGALFFLLIGIMFLGNIPILISALTTVFFLSFSWSIWRS